MTAFLWCEISRQQGKGALRMDIKGKAVDAQFSCAEFRHGFWSLEEEPSVCENCEFYDEGRCFKERKKEDRGSTE